MKQIIFMLCVLVCFGAKAEIISLENNNEVFIDTQGLYRYKRAEEVYQKNCQDSSTEEIRSKCMAAERAVWERGKTQEEIQKQGALYSGKIKVHANGKENYFYVDEGEKGEQIHLLLNRYYFEDGLLHDIKTEEAFSGEIVIGGVEGLSADDKPLRYIAQQKYEYGQAVGQPQLILVEE